MPDTLQEALIKYWIGHSVPFAVADGQDSTRGGVIMRN